MSFIPVDYGESATKFVLIGTDTFGLVVLGHSFGVGVPNVVDGANAIHDSWQAMDIMAVMTTAWRLEEVVLTIGTATGPVTGTDTRTPLLGTINTFSSAPNTSVLIRKTTDQGGRAGRGRIYWPAPPEDQIGNDGSLSAGYLTLSNTVWGDMINDFSLNDVPLRLLHGTATPSPGVITGLSVQSRVATQRRRLRR